MADLLPIILKQYDVKSDNNPDNTKSVNSDDMLENKIKQIIITLQKVVEIQEKLVEFKTSMNKILDDAKDDSRVL